MEDFQIFHWGKLDTIEVMKGIITDVKNLKPMKTEETSWVTILIQLAEKWFKSVLLNLKDS